MHRRIIAGLLLGAAAGLALHALWPDTPRWLALFLDGAAEPFGRLFLRLLLLPVLPLVACSIILGVCEMGDAAKLGRVALKTAGFALLATSLSVVTGLALAQVFQPGKGFPPEARQALMARGTLPTTSAAPAGSAAQAFLSMIPDNPAKAAASGDFIGVMFFAILFGLGLSRVPREKSRSLLGVLEGVYEAAMALIGLIMRLAPYGVAALTLSLTARFGVELLKPLLGYAATVLLAMALHQFVTYSILLRLFSGMSPAAFFSAIREAMLTAFATSSSSATLPVTLSVGQTKLGLPKEIARFVLTVGASANQNGTALYEGVTVLFLAQCFGLELGLGQQVTVLFMAILGGIGTAGVPGGSLPMLMAILAAIGAPPEGVLLILGLDRILDMCRTVLNVTGDLLIAVLVGRSESKHRTRREPALEPAAALLD